MNIVIQRVKEASVEIVESGVINKIQKGIVVLVGFYKMDTDKYLYEIANKILRLRIFEDEHNKMNLSVYDINSQILVIPNFTLSSYLKKGNRPSFDTCLNPRESSKLFEKFVSALKKSNLVVKYGEFGKYMLINIVNDGPVTFSFEFPFP